MKETKGTIRLPTKTQYAFIEMQVEGSPKEIVEAYNDLNEAYWGQSDKGLEVKVWNKLLEAYLCGTGMTAEQMEKLSTKQSWMIHELDKTFLRIKSKEN